MEKCNMHVYESNEPRGIPGISLLMYKPHCICKKSHFSIIFCTGQLFDIESRISSLIRIISVSFIVKSSSFLSTTIINITKREKDK